MDAKQLSHFRIAVKLGEGGMGEVYRATDERLGREVAIKVLPAAVTEDPERLARLEREARILASLNHPNIAGLHDIGNAAGVHFLVMELAPGQSLDKRLAQGPLHQDEALAIAIQVANALEAAHEAGIIHRDLKPANVMVDEAGKVKLLDFGLAKAAEDDPNAAATSFSHSPTLTRATAAGMILGTASYMSPEQARGTPVDKRADVWAFGVMLYEMLAGRRLFEGDTVSDILAAVLRADIDWDALPADTPGELRKVLRRSIVRDADRRLRDIADVRIVLDEVVAGDLEGNVSGQDASAAAATPSRTRPSPLWLAVTFLAGALLVLAGLKGFGLLSASAVSATERLPSVTYRQLTLLPGAESQGAIAPDGESLLFVKNVDGQPDIFLQRVDGQNAINLTESCPDADYGAAFSPDGRRIAYRSECSGGGVFIMGAMGEGARKVTSDGYGPAWSPDGTQLVVADEHPRGPTTRTTRSRMYVVDIATGERRPITDHDAVDAAWSPDGRWIAFWGLPDTASFRDLYIVAADTSSRGLDEVIQVTEDSLVDWSPVWSPDGRWLYFSSTRGGTFNIWRVPIDPQTGRRAGDLQAVTAPSSNVWDLSMSADGRRLVFTDRNVRQRTWLARIDPKSGAFVAPPVEVPMGSMTIGGGSEPSADGRLLIGETTGYPQHLFVVGADGNDLRMLTEGNQRDRQGAWSPDGEWIAFQTDRFEGSAFGLIRSDGSGLRPLGAPPFPAWYPRWSADGRYMSYSSNDGVGRLQPWADDPAATLEPLAPPPDGLNFWVESFSADGSYASGTLYRAADPVSIAVYSFGDRSYETLAAAEHSARAAFVGGSRFVIWIGDTRLMMHDRDTGRSRLLAEVSQGHRMVSFGIPSVGDWVSWTESVDESDIWLATFD